VLGKLPLQLELLLGEVKGFADGGLGVDAGQVKQFDKFLAGFIQNLVVVPDADDVGSTSLSEYLAS